MLRILLADDMTQPGLAFGWRTPVVLFEKLAFAIEADRASGTYCCEDG